MQRSSTARSASADSVAGLAGSAGLSQLARAQQATYMVGAERREAARPDPVFRCARHGHGSALLFIHRISYRQISGAT